MEVNVYTVSLAYMLFLSYVYVRNLDALHQKTTKTANALEMQLYFMYLHQNIVIQIVNATGCLLLLRLKSININYSLKIGFAPSAQLTKMSCYVHL